MTRVQLCIISDDGRQVCGQNYGLLNARRHLQHTGRHQTKNDELQARSYILGRTRYEED